MKVKIFSLFALAIGFAACNGNGDSTSSADSTSTITTTDGTNTATTSNTSENNYAAMADSFRINSEAGNYLNPRTGKPMRLRYDASSRRAVDEATGEPVWRYIDRRTWWVYGDNDDRWDTMGSARIEGNKVMYQGENNKWVDYDKRWKADDEQRTRSYKTKIGDTKIKMDKDGDIKVKDEHGKVKYDADDNKVKVDTSGR